MEALNIKIASSHPLLLANEACFFFNMIPFLCEERRANTVTIFDFFYKKLHRRNLKKEKVQQAKKSKTKIRRRKVK